MKTCRQYVQTTHRRLTFEYALINEVNDSPEMAEQLAQLLTGLLCHVNLIALNPSKEYPLQGSPRERVNQFREILERHGINATIRLRRGVEIHAGCGQLASSRAAE
jgi:23S rRNA (adenine2503-C2)-methyltransferase